MDIEDVFSDLPDLETDRLILRKLTLGDAEDLFEYSSDPEMTKFIRWEPDMSIEDTHNFLVSIMDQYSRHQIAPWGVLHKDDKKVIGTCGFVYWLPEHARAEVSYALSAKYWGKGYGTEAVGAIVSFGFRTMGLNRIEARCEIENVGSARVMEKVGMKFEGVLRQYVFQKGEYRDMEIRSIVKTQIPG